MSSIEHTMATRVAEFVAAMNDLTPRAAATHRQGGTASRHVQQRDRQRAAAISANLPTSSTRMAARSPRRSSCWKRAIAAPMKSVAAKHAHIETLVATLDARTDDFGAAAGALLRACSTNRSTRRQRGRARSPASSPRPATTACRRSSSNTNWSARPRTTSASAPARRSTPSTTRPPREVQAMFNQSAERFTEIMQGMKQMAAEMQQELETTRAELRRGILELPQETADSAAQMRRVIVDQIEALAELNRIVARHGRSLDAAEPVRSRSRAARAAGGRRSRSRREPRARPMSARGPAAPARPSRATSPARRRPTRGDITGAPPRRPVPAPQGKNGGNGRNGGWLGRPAVCAPRARTARRSRLPGPRESAAARNVRATTSSRSIRCRSTSHA